MRSGSYCKQEAGKFSFRRTRSNEPGGAIPLASPASIAARRAGRPVAPSSPAGIAASLFGSANSAPTAEVPWRPIWSVVFAAIPETKYTAVPGWPPIEAWHQVLGCYRFLGRRSPNHRLRGGCEASSIRVRRMSKRLRAKKIRGTSYSASSNGGGHLFLGGSSEHVKHFETPRSRIY